MWIKILHYTSPVNNGLRHPFSLLYIHIGVYPSYTCIYRHIATRLDLSQEIKRDAFFKLSNANALKSHNTSTLNVPGFEHFAECAFPDFPQKLIGIH